MGSCGTKGSLPLGTPKNSSNSNQPILGYSDRRSFAQEIQERKKIQLQGFARKGNETRVIANGVFANGTVRKTRNTMTEYPGAVHPVNKLQKSSTICTPVIWERSLLNRKMFTWSQLNFWSIRRKSWAFFLTLNRWHLSVEKTVRFVWSKHVIFCNFFT